MDDGPFERGSREPVLVVGAVLRGDGRFDGLLTTWVTQDGFDATDELVRMIVGSKFHRQLHYVMIDGVTLGGFNVVDLPRLREATGLKILAITRRPPDLPRVRAAAKALPRGEERLMLLDAAGPLVTVGGLSCQLHGLDPVEAERLLEVTMTHAKLPEPLRVAHLIAGGVVLGQSGHRA